MVNKYVLIGVVIFCLFIFLFIADVPSLYFINDDNIYVPASRNLKYLYGTSFRPISDITLFWDYSVWHTNPLGYHITNFILHCITALLVFYLARTFYIKYGDGAPGNFKPLLVSVLFFFYPFHSEAIFWIIGRGGLLGTLFGLASIQSYLNRRKSNWYMAFAVLFFLTGAFAYENIWIVPVVIIIVSYFDIKLHPLQKKHLINDAIVFNAFFLLYILVRTRIIGELGGSPYGSAGIVKLDIWPWIKNYNIMIARSFLPPVQSSALLCSLYIFLVLTGLFFFRKLTRQGGLPQPMLLSLTCFMISFAPVITLGVDSHDSESERFLYFPSVFVVLLVVEIVFKLGKSASHKLLFFSLLFSTEIFYLSRAAKVYQISSRVARVSMSAVTEMHNYGNVYCINLPTQYKGGFIYRLGFSEAVVWLTDRDKIKIVKVSAKEMAIPTQHYFVRHFNLNELPAAESAGVLKQLLPAHFITGEDVIMKWTDSSLQVIE